MTHGHYNQRRKFVKRKDMPAYPVDRSLTINYTGMKMLTSTASVRRIILFAVSIFITGFSSNTGVNDLSNKEQLIFVTVTYPSPGSEKNTLLLVESIRAFAGSLRQAPIWCLIPQYGKQLSPETESRLTALDVTLMPYNIEIEVARFFFAADIRAAQIAESISTGKTDLIVWLGSNTIILKEPQAFVLPVGKALGYRPVHHANIGSVYGTPMDQYWTLVYRYCEVPESRIFAMKTHIDGQELRPYFNAGMIVTRPNNRLFKTWHDIFFSVYQAPELQELYRKDERYLIFIHQALLSGIIMRIFDQNETAQLPGAYNYPIHLHQEDMTESRPALIDELVSVRHEGFYEDPDWTKKIPASDSLKQWLEEQLSK
jgi:hypothetical protein